MGYVSTNDRIQPIIRPTIPRLVDESKFATLESRSVLLRKVSLFGYELAQTLELRAPKRSIEVRHTIIEANLIMFILIGMRLLGGGSQMLRSQAELIGAEDHTAATGSNDFVSVETQSPEGSKSSRVFALINTAQRLGGVFNN